MSNNTNTTTAASSWRRDDGPTHFLEEETKKDQRREIYDIVNILEGCIVSVFSLFIIVCFTVSKVAKIGSLSRRISLSLMILTVFAFIHGWMYAGIYTYQRRERRGMAEETCIVTTLLIDFCDHFMLILLVLVAIERFLIVFFPFMEKKKRTVIVVILFVLDLIAAILVPWLPLVPGLTPPEPGYQAVSNQQQQRVSSFQLAYSCNLKLNKRNWFSPYLLLAVQLICTAGVCILLVLIHLRIRKTVLKSGDIGDEEKKQLKQGAVHVAIISVVAILTTLPYSVMEAVRNDCDDLFEDDYKQNDCSAWGIELRFVFRIIFHSSDFFAPFLFTMLDPQIRAEFLFFLSCGKYQKNYARAVGPETELQTQTVWDHDTNFNVEKKSNGSIGNSNGNLHVKSNGYSNSDPE